MNLVIFGLSITSSWGNGHATTYRGLVRELAARGHEVLFLERDVPWYADHRDAPHLPHVTISLYRSLAELKMRYRASVRDADAVIVGSYVPQGALVGEWVLDTARGVTAFYDIDTPVTLAKLRRRETDYLSPALVPRYDLYLSFTGGPTLRRIEREFGSPRARALYCSVDPAAHYPEPHECEWDLGYLGTYSPDRQPALEALMLRVAETRPQRRFAVAGAQYPRDLRWPANVRRFEHLPPGRHRRFYNRQRFTLNLTRADMIAAGYSPSVRLFEAAACGVPIVTDSWPGLEEIFAPGREVFIARSSRDVLLLLEETAPETARAVGEAARRKILAHHTAAHRATELELLLHEARDARTGVPRRRRSASSRKPAVESPTLAALSALEGTFA
jgi:spore maturation protein CgeB